MKTDDIGKSRAERSWVADPAARTALVVGPGEPDLLGGAFGLTEAEQQVVHGLIRGHGPADIADALGLTVLTTRAHIKRAYAKLEVRSKEDLFVRLIGYLVH